MRRISIGVTLVLLSQAAPLGAADLQSQTIAAFNQYQRATEARLDAAAPFLWVDALSPDARTRALADLNAGELLIARMTTTDRGRDIEVPDGIIHHWIGTAFVPGASVEQAVSLLQDYDSHARIYAPAVAGSKLLARDGDRFRVFLRFAMTKVITVVVNSEHEARFTRGSGRAEARIRSTRIAEVDDPGTAAERELPVGRDGGYLWRLNTYWRLLARDGGTYVQCESISLTRAIPFGLGVIVKPFVASIPRESLAFTLETTRKQLARKRG